MGTGGRDPGSKWITFDIPQCRTRGFLSAKLGSVIQMPFSVGDKLGYVDLKKVVAYPRPSKVVLLRICVILGLLAGFALSPKLWLSSRLYPLTPVWSFIGAPSSPIDHIIFFVLIALLIVVSVAPRRG